MAETPNEIRYKKLSLVFMQIFAVDDFGKRCRRQPLFNNVLKNIDDEIFLNAETDSPVEHYRIGEPYQTDGQTGFRYEGFDFEIELEKPERVTLAGHMFVEFSVFFERTVSVTYRMVIDGQQCSYSPLEALTTDHIISLASLSVGAEHWNYDNDENPDESGIMVKNKMEITGFRIDPQGKFHKAATDGQPVARRRGENEFDEIRRRYKRFITGDPTCDITEDMNYVYVDVWEDVSDSRKTFATLKESEVIDDIWYRHRPELIGLMSFYPYEWRYRDPDAFDEVCGPDIAIDTDDLIFVNQYITVVFGTYGRRGKGEYTDWVKHLKEMRGKYHVSWPEYLLILEVVLARKFTVSHAMDQVATETDLKKSNKGDIIYHNSELTLDITRRLIRMDAVKYTRCLSHKIMFERTSQRLEVEQEIKQLDNTMTKIDRALANITESNKWRKSNTMNVILLALSVLSAASLVNILFQNVQLPYYTVRGADEATAQSIGIKIIDFTLIGAILVIILLVILLLILNKPISRKSKKK